MSKKSLDRQNEHSTSLNKYISSTGICSRREANQIIAEGRVTINGKVATLGNRVFEGDKVKMDGRLVRNKVKTLYIAYNKPVGVVSTTDPKERDNIISMLTILKDYFQ